MKCFDDPTRDAVGVCVRCGKGVCPEDAVYINGKLYCKDCAKIVLGENKTTHKTLYRSRKNRSICGVCGGFAEYSGMDATLIRVLYVLITIFTGFLPGILIYLAMCLIMPKEPLQKRY